MQTMKMNIKRAFKTMNKEGVGNSYYYRLPNSNVLVSNGHIVTTVDSIQFEEYKDILNHLQEYPKLLDIAKDNMECDTVNVRPTSLTHNGDKTYRILKSEQGKLVAVNEKYLQVFDDCLHGHWFETKKPETSEGRIMTPLFNGVMIKDTKEVFSFNCILPVSMDCETLLNNILEN
jgi:hypothetical protein